MVSLNGFFFLMVLQTRTERRALLPDAGIIDVSYCASLS